MKKIFIVGNPTAGTGKYDKIHALLVKQLTEEKIAFSSHVTTADKNATAVVRNKFDDTYTDIITIGGDGTLNEVVNGLNRTVPLGIIPAGTGNDYVKCYDLGKTIQEKVNTAIYGNLFTVDLGTCNNKKFLNGVGIGFDGQIVADIEQKKTWLKGVIKYYYHVLSILGSYQTRKFKYALNGVKQREDLILLCIAKGTTFGGGFKLTPHAKPNDGSLAVCKIGGVSPLKRFLNIYRMQNGTHQVLKEIGFIKASTVSVEENDLLEAHIDGEYLGRPPFVFGIEKGVIQVRAKKLL